MYTSLNEPKAGTGTGASTPWAHGPSRRTIPRACASGIPRSYLLVPGDRPELFVMALVSSADVLVLDLRDAVAPAAKGEARDTIAQWCGEVTAQDRARLIVRINEAQSIDFADDLCLLRDARVAGVMLPKVESAAQVQAVRAALPDARVIASIQTAQGVAAAHEVACADGVVCLVFETLAYAVDLDIDLDMDLAGGADGLSHAAGVLAVASRVAGLPAPVAGATPQLDEEHRLIEDLVWARRHGLGGKLCIHPRQVPMVHAVLAPGSLRSAPAVPAMQTRSIPEQSC